MNSIKILSAFGNEQINQILSNRLTRNYKVESLRPLTITSLYDKVANGYDVLIFRDSAIEVKLNPISIVKKIQELNPDIKIIFIMENTYESFVNDFVKRKTEVSFLQNVSIADLVDIIASSTKKEDEVIDAEEDDEDFVFNLDTLEEEVKQKENKSDDYIDDSWLDSYEDNKDTEKVDEDEDLVFEFLDEENESVENTDNNSSIAFIFEDEEGDLQEQNEEEKLENNDTENNNTKILDINAEVKKTSDNSEENMKEEYLLKKEEFVDKEESKVEDKKEIFKKNKKKENQYNFESLVDILKENNSNILLFMSAHNIESQSAMRTTMVLAEDRNVVYLEFDKMNFDLLDTIVHPRIIPVKVSEDKSVETVLNHYKKYAVKGKDTVCVINTPYDNSLLSLGLFGKIIIEFTQNRFVVDKFAGDMLESMNDDNIYYLVSYYEDELWSVNDIEVMLQQKVYIMKNTRLLEYQTRKGKRLIRLGEEG